MVRRNPPRTARGQSPSRGQTPSRGNYNEFETVQEYKITDGTAFDDNIKIMISDSISSLSSSKDSSSTTSDDSSSSGDSSSSSGNSSDETSSTIESLLLYKNDNRYRLKSDSYKKQFDNLMLSILYKCFSYQS